MMKTIQYEEPSAKRWWISYLCTFVDNTVTVNYAIIDEHPFVWQKKQRRSMADDTYDLTGWKELTAEEFELAQKLGM